MCVIRYDLKCTINFFLNTSSRYLKFELNFLIKSPDLYVRSIVRILNYLKLNVKFFLNTNRILIKIPSGGDRLSF